MRDQPSSSPSYRASIHRISLGFATDESRTACELTGRPIDGDEASIETLMLQTLDSPCWDTGLQPCLAFESTDFESTDVEGDLRCFVGFKAGEPVAAAWVEDDGSVSTCALTRVEQADCERYAGDTAAASWRLTVQEDRFSLRYSRTVSEQLARIVRIDAMVDTGERRGLTQIFGRLLHWLSPRSAARWQSS